MTNDEYRSMDMGLKLLFMDVIHKRSVSADAAIDEIKGQIMDAYLLGYKRGQKHMRKAQEMEPLSPREPLYTITSNR